MRAEKSGRLQMTQMPQKAHTLTQDRYMIRSQFFRFFGGAFHIYDPSGNLALYCDQKRFKMKEDIRLYTDESKQFETLKISTQSILDISGAYDVKDSQSGEPIGSLKRSGVKSTFLQDQWEILDTQGQSIGQIQEESTLKALARRYIELTSLFLPQKYLTTIHGKQVATFQQRLNPFILKIDIDFSHDVEDAFDRRLGLAAAVLLSAIEGSQS